MKRILAVLIVLLMLLPCASALEYDEVYQTGNYLWQRKGDRWYFCNAEGTAFPGCSWPNDMLFHTNAWILFEELSDTRIGLCFGSPSEGKWGIIDNCGRIIVEPQYDYLKYFSENRALILKGSLWAVADALTGEIIIPYEREIGPVDAQGLAVFCRSSRYGYMDVDGNIRIQPQFDYAVAFDEEGFAWVQNNGLWGLIDLQGNFVIEPQYNSYDPVSNSLYWVEINGKWGAIDHSGNVVIDIVYDELSYSPPYDTFTVGRDGQYGYLNSAGEWLLPPVYEYASFFDEAGYAIVKSGGLYGMIDRSGNYLIEPSYDEIHRSENCRISMFQTWVYTEEAYHAVTGDCEAYFDIVDGAVIPGGSSS